MVDKKPKQNKIKVIAWVMITLVVSAAASFFLTYPQFQNFIKINEEIKFAENRFSNLERKLKQLEQINESLINSDLDLTKKILPLERDIISAVSQVQILAANHTLTIDDLLISVSPQGEQGGANKADTFSIKLSLGGDIPNVKTFLNKLRESPRIMRTEIIDLTGSKVEVTYKTDTGLATYYQGLPTSIGGVDAPLQNIDDKDRDTLNKINQNINSLPVLYLQDADGPKGKEDPFN